MNNSNTSLRDSKLSLGLKLEYGLGASLDAVVNTALNIFLLFYATTACGLSPGLAGGALGLALVVDAIAEPLIALYSDNFHSRWGRRLPFMLFATPMVMIGMVLLFSLPNTDNQLLLFSSLFVSGVLLRVSLSIFNLPYLAAGAEFTDDQAERASIITLRWVIGMIAAFVTIAIGFSVFFKIEGSIAHREQYAPFAMTLSAIILVAAILSMHAVRRTLARQHVTAAIRGSLFSTIAEDMRELVRSHSFCILFGVALLFSTAQGVTQTLGLHANTFFWHLNTEQTQLTTLALGLGLILGAPFAGPVISRLENKTAVVIGLCGIILMQASPAILKLAGILTLQGQALALTIATVNVLGGMVTTVAAIALLTMITNAADEHEHRFGVRREGSYFAGWSFACKAASGLGTLVSGLALQAINFPVEQSKELGVKMVLPESTSNALGFFYGPGAAVFTLLAALLLIAFHLDRKAHAAIMVDLQARRAKALAE
ncbi:MFS transporter [Stenotrophobium rhamnosiphilum]|uniref:MFS transporter n=1 Tax=Stenotrophobium rhamnosiphilum TaxID=2029166 RepID=A0A2T5MGY2_9GAMM|nr:MFS transporter [Stenotrophobium rhamnosiphilum]PTU31845.1 MFS transporter [Stenotrophobium rhamnosiphilum]